MTLALKATANNQSPPEGATCNISAATPSCPTALFGRMPTLADGMLSLVATAPFGILTNSSFN